MGNVCANFDEQYTGLALHDNNTTGLIVWKEINKIDIANAKISHFIPHDVYFSQNLLPILPTVQLGHWLTSLEAM